MHVDHFLYRMLFYYRKHRLSLIPVILELFFRGLVIPKA